MERNWTIRIALYALVTAISLVVGCGINTGAGGCHSGDYRAKAQRTEELTAPLGNIVGLDVETNVGTIRLDHAELAEAQITAHITVRARTEAHARELVEKVHIRVEPSGRNLVIRAIKPPGFGRNQLAVDFAVTAPGHWAVRCKTNVGDIRITDFAHKVHAKTDVGKIICRGLQDTAELQTNVGDIRATYAPDAPAAVDLAATTNVGNVEFTGPGQISAQLAARVNVGSIDTDRPLTITGPIKKSINATLGNAQGNITLRTNVGSIRIR